MQKNPERGTFKRLIDPRLGMVITRWRDSKTLQTVSTEVMGVVDLGDQHRVVGAGFTNVAHFKKWYKKAFFGIADFCLLQAFTAWNLSIDASDRKSSESRRKKIVKW